MRPRVHSQDAYAEIEYVARKRDELPTDADLARKHGMSRMYVSYLMLEARKKLDRKGVKHRYSEEVSAAPAEVVESALMVQQLS
jgi:hypothetical protein